MKKRYFIVLDIGAIDGDVRRNTLKMIMEYINRQDDLLSDIKACLYHGDIEDQRREGQLASEHHEYPEL